MLDVLVAVIGWLVLGWAPGFTLLTTLRPSAPALENVAVASLASIGVVMLTAEGVYLLGMPVRPWTVLPVVVVVCFLPALVTHRWPNFREVRRTRVGVDALLVMAAVAIGVLVWCLIVRSPSAVLPGTDGAHHGLFASRIERFGTLDPSKILAGDTSSASPTISYYPLALHVTAALIAGSTGIPVSVALTVAVVLAAALILPIGTYLLVSWLCRAPHAGGIAAVLSVALPWFPYEPVVWGGVPTIVGICQVPAAVVVMARPGRPRSTPAEGLALGICGYGLFTEHNPELVTAGIIGIALAVPALRHARRTVRRTKIGAYVLGSVLVLLAVAPQIPAMAAGAAGSSPQFKMQSSTSTGRHVVAMVSPSDMYLALGLTLLPLVGLGALTSHRKQWRRGWGWACAALIAIFALSFSTSEVATVITAPWYATPFRTTYQLSIVLVGYAAGGLAGALSDLRAFGRNRGRRGVASVVAVACCALALICLPTAVAIGARGYRDSSLVGADQRAAFRWLHDHVPPSSRVLNDFNDGSGWMEILAGVHPLFATRVDDTNVSSWGERGYLLQHAAALGSDARDQAAVRIWDVRYVYINAKHFDGNPQLLSLQDFRDATGYSLVWHRGDVSIFELAP